MSTSSPLPVTKVAHSQRPIPALTGLRFFAAFFILWEHSIDWIARFQNTDVTSYFSFIGVPGMSLFFVLSGFVIHYNYRDLLLRREISRSVCEFAAARFARLYPLYLVFLFVAVGANTLVVLGRHGIPILAYYVTLTQSWWYAVSDGKLLINWVFPLSWSVSTEIFFYAAYPAVVFLIAPISGARMISIAAFYACLVLIALTAAWIYLDDFLQVAQGWVSNYVDSETSRDDSFYRWFFYFSPYTRVLEFFLGCMMAQAIIQLATRPPSHRECQWGNCALSISLVLLLLISLIEANTIELPGLSDVIQHLENSFLCAPPVAVILFCAARYKTWFVRFLSLPWLVMLGEMSYSIYLVHTWTLRLFIHPSRPFIWPQVVDVILCISCGIALTIFLSYGTYNLIEIPGRIWLRRSLAAAIDLVFGQAATVAASRSELSVPKRKAKRLSFAISAALALALLSVSGQATKSDRLIEYVHGLFAKPGPKMLVVSASYGRNCSTGLGNPLAANSTGTGNVTAKVREHCRFTAFCVVRVDDAWLGDPAPGCAKDFDVTYQCGHATMSDHIDGEASGKSLVIRCSAKSIDSGG
jgi:peptidoglycan/LPS O-acetylase OafA/YrhL